MFVGAWSHKEVLLAQAFADLYAHWFFRSVSLGIWWWCPCFAFLVGILMSNAIAVALHLPREVVTSSAILVCACCATSMESAEQRPLMETVIHTGNETIQSVQMVLES